MRLLDSSLEELNLFKTAGRFINQKHKGQEKIISITIANKEVALMQMWVKSIHWLLLKRETIPTKHLIDRKGVNGIFCPYIILLSERQCPEKVNISFFQM